MAYKCMVKLITKGTRSKAELLDMADVYYAAGRLTDTQYTEIVATIEGL